MKQSMACGLTVLLVEQGEGRHRGVRQMLEAGGHAVVEADTAEDAFESALDYTGEVRPDVILLNSGALPSQELAAFATWHSDLALNDIPLLMISNDAAGAPMFSESQPSLKSANGESLRKLVTRIIDGRFAAAALPR